jgi:hypothetical protein
LEKDFFKKFNKEIQEKNSRILSVTVASFLVGKIGRKKIK